MSIANEDASCDNCKYYTDDARCQKALNLHPNGDFNPYCWDWRRKSERINGKILLYLYAIVFGMLILNYLLP